MSALEYLGNPPIASDHQPRPFSPAVRAGDFVYVSGQVPADDQCHGKRFAALDQEFFHHAELLGLKVIFKTQRISQ